MSKRLVKTYEGYISGSVTRRGMKSLFVWIRGSVFKHPMLHTKYVISKSKKTKKCRTQEGAYPKAWPPKKVIIEVYEVTEE